MPENSSYAGEFHRDTRYINDRIVSDLPPGSPPVLTPDGHYLWPVESGRYRLIGARACPWAHRAIITRRLLGLDSVISLGLAGPLHDSRSWTFDLDPHHKDPVLGIHFLRDAYLRRFPDYAQGITVPCLIDVTTGKVVTNNFQSITEDFSFQWRKFHHHNAPQLWPKDRCEEMRELMEWIYNTINNGVYRCGFAQSQHAYDTAYEQLWSALDVLEDRLSRQRFLMGSFLSEADIRLYCTLIRFDAVYHNHFKCNRNKISEMPHLWGYLKELFQIPAFGETTDFHQIKQHYYGVHSDINPTGIIPQGPDLSPLLQPHGREFLPDSAFPSEAGEPDRS
ncbi:glutathione S-transferase family protein [Corynebacterium sp. 3HC-13]|uniref:glutathione S-transferase family protein n=1 Tax=Corynebacterium poyangense TaxID=2684405 RepID=UPI001CCA7E91|nr:glutathione S-transferase C-terminal domain-containing protein [Corynebacterium poyangense]MBZ8177124.1 glutathione S-transferase family protein [Corynebacterium poyangense]